MGDEHIGRNISVETTDGVFKGVIHGVDVKNKKLILNKVSMSDGKKLRGLQIFFTNEIKNLHLLDDGLSPDEQNGLSSPVNVDGADTTGETEEAKEIEEDEILENESAAKDPSDEGSRLIARKPIAPSRFLAGEEICIKNRNKELRDPPEVVFVDELDEKFKDAIAFINEQRVVGLAAEGENIGRSGQLFFLTIGCRKTTYVFDVYKLGNTCFSDGLKSVLENSYLLKVIHDCRFLSDCLHHQYQTKMVNIFDTQVADIIIYKQKRGKLPRDVNGLVACLYEYLNLKPAQCQFHTVLSGFYKMPNGLKKRPLPAELIDAVAEKVLYLRELKIAQTENMLAEFLHGVDVYLDVFRSATDRNLNSVKSKRVPAAFSRPGNAEERRWKRYEEMDKKIASEERMTTERKDEKLNGSKDSTTENNLSWTEGKDFANSYQKRHGKIVERNDVDKITRRCDDSRQQSGLNENSTLWGSIRKESGFEATTPDESLVFISESKVRPKKWERSSADNEKTVNTNLHSKDEAKKCLIEDRPSDSGAQGTSEGQKNESRSFVKARKPPVDWFDCDTPSTDRSRSSSIDAEISVRTRTTGRENLLKPESSRVRTTSNNSLYDEEFPELSPERQKTSPKRHGGQESAQKENIPGNACRDIFASRGVRQPSPQFESRGRARLREMNASRATISSPHVGLVSQLPRKFGVKNSFAFPSDNDLLDTNPIIQSDQVDFIGGQNVKLQKIMTKND